MSKERVEFRGAKIIFYDSRGLKIGTYDRSSNDNPNKIYQSIVSANEAGFISDGNLGRFNRILEKQGLERSAKDRTTTKKIEALVKKLSIQEDPTTELIRKLATYDECVEELNKQTATLKRLGESYKK